MDSRSVADDLSAAAEILIDNYHDAMSMLDKQRVQIEFLERQALNEHSREFVQIQILTKLSKTLTTSKNPTDHKYGKWLLAKAQKIRNKQ